MENAVIKPAKTVTVFSTINQRKIVLSSRATTYGELRGELSQHISDSYLDLDNSRVVEGYSKLAIESDGAQLPTNIKTPNGVTNDLTLVITPKSKIKSGVSPTRAELYDEIGELIQQDPRAKEYFKYFTNKSNSVLYDMIQKYSTYLTLEAEEERQNKFLAAMDQIQAEAEKQTITTKSSSEGITLSKESFSLLNSAFTHLKIADELIRSSGILDVVAIKNDLSIAELNELANTL